MSFTLNKENSKCCLKDVKPRKSSASADDNDIDMLCLNNALHELGMLSAITESRKQFLQENAVRKMATAKIIRKEPTNTGCVNKGFCVLHMNSDYVTDLSGMWKCSPLSKSGNQSIELHHKLTSKSSDSKFNVLSIRKDDGGCCYGRNKSKLNRFRLHVQKRPYNGPWMQRWESHEWFPNTMTQSEILLKDSGSGGATNRSNPGSPEKGLPEVINSLVRSRSLDDIENFPGSTPNSSDASISGQKSEIETMSKKLESLHVI